MHQLIFILCLVVFLMISPCLLSMRFFRNKPSWWVIIIIIPVFGWLAALGSVIFYYDYLGDLIAQYQNPPQELIGRWSNDGAKKLFTLYFGWLYSLVYSLPWLVLYFAAITMRRWLQKSPNTE